MAFAGTVTITVNITVYYNILWLMLVAGLTRALIGWLLVHYSPTLYYGLCKLAKQTKAHPKAASVLFHKLIIATKYDVWSINTWIASSVTPRSLNLIRKTVRMFLSDSKFPFNILLGKEFEMSCQVLATKRKNSLQKDHSRQDLEEQAKHHSRGDRWRRRQTL